MKNNYKPYRKKIIFLPYSSENVYQEELCRDLRILGNKLVGCAESKFLPLLIPVIKNWKPNILHIHWTHNFIKSKNKVEEIIKCGRTVVEVAILRLLGVKIVWTVHNLHQHDAKDTYYEDLMHRFLIRVCSSIIVHCEYAKKCIADKFRINSAGFKKLYIIPHGELISFYKNFNSKRPGPRLPNLSSDGFVFGFIGLLRPYKGVELLIREFSKLKNPKLKLLIAGQPFNNQLEMKLRELSKGDERITIIPKFIDYEDMQYVMNSIDVMVLPFQEVLTSGSAVTAMSFGKPVIAPKKGCLNELFKENTELLYDGDNSEGLSESMKKSLKIDLKAVGQKNEKLIGEIRWDICAKLTDNIYNNVIPN